MVDIATNDDGSIDYENATVDGKMALIAEAQGDSPSAVKAMFWESAAGVDMGDNDPEKIVDTALNSILNDAFEEMGKGRPWGDSTPSARTRSDGGEATASYEKYGTGMQDETESTIFGGASAEEREHYGRAPVWEGDDLDGDETIKAYGTGLQDSAESTINGGASAAEHEHHARGEAREGDDLDDEELLATYGTGLQGDNSRERHQEREEEIEKMAEAMRRARQDDDEE